MFEVLEGAIAPTRATKYSAMVDLYANADVVILAGETKIIPLGVKIKCDEEFVYSKMQRNGGSEAQEYDGISHDFFLKSHYLELHPRSSLRAKGLIIGVGVIDLDYPDELGLIVHNPIGQSEICLGFSSHYTIKKGDKIAQCTLIEHKGLLMGIESEIDRAGGFGSTDK